MRQIKGCLLSQALRAPANSLTTYCGRIPGQVFPGAAANHLAGKPQTAGRTEDRRARIYSVQLKFWKQVWASFGNHTWPPNHGTPWPRAIQRRQLALVLFVFPQRFGTIDHYTVFPELLLRYSVFLIKNLQSMQKKLPSSFHWTGFLSLGYPVTWSSGSHLNQQVSSS